MSVASFNDSVVTVYSAVPLADSYGAVRRTHPLKTSGLGCRIRLLSASETVVDGKEADKATHRAYFQGDPDIVHTDTIVDQRGRAFDVVNAESKIGRHKEVGLLLYSTGSTTSTSMTTSGTVALTSGVEFQVVTFPVALASSPIVVVTVVKPTNGSNIIPSITTSSATGFRVEFSSTIPATGYSLNWMAMT